MVEAGRVTAIIDGDISQLTSKLAQAKSQATTAVSGIESDIRGKLGTGLSGALSGGDFGKAGKQIGGSLVDGISSSFGPLGGAVGEVATALGPAGLMATAAVAGAVMIGSAASGAAREWESGMSQISKTTGIEKGSAGFAELSGQLKDLTSTMPTTVSEIQGVASAAGSLGIAQASIAGFTEVALQMGSAFDIPAEQAAVSLGKIQGQVKAFPEECNNALGKVDAAAFAQHMGSAIDFVGNSFNATEADVLDFSTRVGGSLSALGANVYETAGWGGMLASVFPSAERAAGSFDSLLTNLTTNTESQTAASELLGVSVEDFMQAMTTDPSGTLLAIGSALDGLPTDKLMSVSKDLGGAYGMDVLTKMVGHTEEWGQAIEDTVAAGQKGESIGTSFKAGADTADKGFQVLKNSIGMILTDIGGPINDVASAISGSLGGSFNAVRAIGENLWGPFTTAISPLTFTISTVAGAVGKLGGMTLGGLVAASKAINTAFQVGKAFVSAFGEEISEIITNSSAFQTVSGYVTDIGDAFSGVWNTASDVFGKIVSGLSDAIPTAISGVIGALGTLADKAGLGGVADAFGGGGDFLGNVWDNAMGKLGEGTEDAIGEGAEKGMEKGADAAKPALKESVTEAVKTGVNDGFDAAKDALKKLGVSEELAGQMAAFGYTEAQALAAINSQGSSADGYGSAFDVQGVLGKNRGSGTRVTKIGELDVGLRYDADKNRTTASLWIDGQQVAGPVYGTDSEDMIRQLMSQTDMAYDTGNVLDFQGKTGEADLWRLHQSVQFEFDYDLIAANFGEQFAARMENEGEIIGTTGSQVAIDSYTALLDNMRAPMLDNLGAVLDEISTLSAERPLAASEYELFGQEFKDKIKSQIVDAREFVETELADFSQIATNSLSGGIIDQTEANEMLGLKPQLEYIRDTFPGWFAMMGGEGFLALIAALEAGDYAGAAKMIDEQLVVKPTVDLSIFGSEMADVAGSINLADILADPEEFKESVMDIPDFMKNTFQPALGEEIDFAIDQWDHGYGKARAQTENFVNDMAAAANRMPELFTPAQINKLDQYQLGLISARQALEGLGYEAKETAAAIDTVNYAMAPADQFEADMYYGSFIGKTSDYAQWLVEDSGRSEAEAREILISLGTAEAEEELKKLDERATAEQTKKIEINDRDAMATIAGIDLAAAKAITKTVYIDYIDSGYYSDYEYSEGSDDTGSSGKSLDWGKYGSYYLPFSFANEGYVASPTLAVVGDRPGGEYVVGAARFEAAASKMGNGGGQAITMAPVYHINGTGLSVDEIASLLEKNNRALLQEVADQIKTGKAF